MTIQVDPKELLEKIKKRVRELKAEDVRCPRCIDVPPSERRIGVLEGLIAVAREIEPGYTGDEP